MRKIFIQCECGQRMQVARSAVGKVGMCPTCGRKMRILDGNTQPLAGGPVRGKGPGRRPAWRSNQWANQNPQEREEGKRLFGRAADLFCNGQYGEAMALFDELVERFPGNPDIESAREQCLRARMNAPLGLPHHGASGGAGIATDRESLRRAVKEKLVDKLQFGSTDMVQLQAAELLARLEGFFERDGHAEPVEKGPEEAAQEADGAETTPPAPAEQTNGEAGGAAESADEAGQAPPPFDPDDFEAELSRDPSFQRR